ncbi:unnamed protein product [Cylindrotheca closterium]|uniref:Transglutaminase-like domain-containing protein n=1 Tax=Cylindrotheca closterium TaxID=2856 RepID=A0AAD2G1Z1_9STRA|nr:unnamed protein product [Cylindrotheca closterium]
MRTRTSSTSTSTSTSTQQWQWQWQWKWLLILLWQSSNLSQALTPLEAKSMSAKVVISSGVEFQSSVPPIPGVLPAAEVPDVSSVLATLTSFPRESFHQKVQNVDVTGNPQPEAVTRDEFNNLQLYWTKPNTPICSFQLQATVNCNSNILPIHQKIPFPISEDILPPDIVNDFLKITEIANQNAQIQQIAHSITNAASQGDMDNSDLYHVVFAIADWVQTNIKYDKNAMKTTKKKNPSKAIGICKSATETLRTGVGKCDELSALFVSLNRALGIPARFVTGYAYTNIPIGNSEEENWGGHAWAEVYFPGIGWVPFDVAYGEYGYLSAGHVMLSTSDDAADNTNVHYHAQGFDFTITPRIIDISVTPDELITQGAEDWGDLQKTSSAQDVQVSLEAPPQEAPHAGIGEVIRLLCTLTNPHDYYVCTRLDIANTQDTTLLDELSDHVLLNPKQTKQIPLAFQVDPNLQKGYAYEFPFSVASGAQEARTTIMVKDQADSRQKQIQGMKMQWENPARRPYYDNNNNNDPRGPQQQPPYNGGYYDGRDSGSTGNTAGDWWGEAGGKSMFMSNQPRQPTPEDWKRAEQGGGGGSYRGGVGGPQQQQGNIPGYPGPGGANIDPRVVGGLGGGRGYQPNDRGGFGPPPPPEYDMYQPSNQWNPNQAMNRGPSNNSFGGPGSRGPATNSFGTNSFGVQPPPPPMNNNLGGPGLGGVNSFQQQQQQQPPMNPRPTTAPSNSRDADWFEKAGETIYDSSNGWWNKEKREGNKVVRDYEKTYVDNTNKQPPLQQQGDTTWSMGPKGRVDDTRGAGRVGGGYADSSGGATRGPSSYGTARGYDNPTPGIQNPQRFENPNRYDNNVYKGQPPQQPGQYGGGGGGGPPNMQQGYSSYGGGQAPADGGAWRGDDNARKNFSNEWQRNDLLGRSREKYLQGQMGNQQPPPPPGFGGGGGPYDPYGPPPPPGMMGDPYYPQGQGDYRNDPRMMGGQQQQQQQQQGRQNYDGRGNPSAGSSYYGNADSQTWWDDK